MLDALLTPQTIAVIGASRSPGKVGHEVVANLIAGGFRGVIVPVNPSAGEVLGLKCYPGLEVCGNRIDLSVIAVPTALVRQAVVSSIDAGAKAVVVITAGSRKLVPKAPLWRRRSPTTARRGAWPCSAPTAWD
jgi:acetyltransferase